MAVEIVLIGMYRDVVIETYVNPGDPSNAKIRARPLPGQGLDTEMKVECSRKMREGYPVGTKFVLKAKVIDRDGGTPFLYAHYNARYTVLSASEADAFIKEQDGYSA